MSGYREELENKCSICPHNYYNCLGGKEGNGMPDEITRILDELKEIHCQRDECREEIKSLQRKEQALAREQALLEQMMFYKNQEGK